MKKTIAVAAAIALLGSAPVMAASKKSRSSDRSGDMEVKALNILSAQGYTSIQDVKASGNQVTATATKDGQSQQVTVDAQSGQIGGGGAGGGDMGGGSGGMSGGGDMGGSGSMGGAGGGMGGSGDMGGAGGGSESTGGGAGSMGGGM